MQTIQAAIASSRADGSESLQLRREVAGRFYRAHDPVVLLRGDDMHPSRRHGSDHKFSPDGSLRGRLTTEILRALRYTSGNESGEIVTDRVAVELPANTGDNLSNLVREVLFYDTSFAAHLLAANPAADQQLDLPALAQLQDRLLEVVRSTTDSDAMFPDLLRPAERASSVVGVHSYRPPFFALFLHWQANFRPLADIQFDYPADFLRERYEHTHGTDADLLTELPDVSRTVLETFEGRAILSPRAAVELKTQIEEILNIIPDSSLREIADSLLELPMLAQTMAGFHESLLMRRESLQLRIEDPLAADPMSRRFSNQIVRNAVADENVVSPVPHAAFHPLRCGAIQFTNLRVIDTFGQVRTVPVEQPARSAALTPPGTAPDSTVYLPPRLSQAARLNFRWRSALDAQLESNQHPASSPVCGWLLANHLMNGLAVYSRDGIAVGNLQFSGAEQNLVWQTLPDQPATPEAALPAGDPLRGLLENLLGGNRAGFVQELLRVADRTSTVIESPSREQQALAVLFGRPLALVRATLALELDGLPAINLSQNSLATTLYQYEKTGEPGFRDTREFPALRIPLRLGHTTSAEDGLIGYFIEHDEGTDYGVFYAPASDQVSGEIRAPRRGELFLDFRKPLSITMLIDPRCAVHATTGILPVKRIDIPSELYAGPLERLSVSFPVHPLLSPLARSYAPVPVEPGYEWDWVAPAGQPAPALSAQADPPGRFRAVGLREGWLRLRHSGRSS